MGVTTSPLLVTLANEDVSLETGNVSEYESEEISAASITEKHDEIEKSNEDVTSIRSGISPITDSTNIYDVTTLGANGSDELEDSTGIQQALDKALILEDADEMIIVYIPAGNYYIESSLRIYSNTILRLDENATLFNSRLSTAMLVGTGDQAIGGYGQFQNIIVEGGVWDGNDLNGEYHSGLIFFRHGSDVIIRNTTIKNGTDHFLNLSGTRNALVENVLFKDTQEYKGDDIDFWKELPQNEVDRINRLNFAEALHVDYTNPIGEPNALPHDDTPPLNITIKNCVFDNVYSGIGTHHSVEDVYASNIKIQNNTFKNIMYTCISSFNYQGLTVEGNRAENINNFIIAHKSEGEVFNNEIIGIFQGGLESNLIHRIRVRNSKLSIYNNQIDGGNRFGIYADEQSDVTITNNTIKNCKETGISLLDTKASISNNEISNMGRHGFVFENAVLTEVSKNNITNVEQCGIYGENISGILSENTIKNTNEHGIRVVKSKDIEVRENAISEVAYSGISLRDNEEGDIVLNTVNTAKHNGIIVENCENINVQQNTFQNNTEAGISFTNSDGDISHNVIKTAGRHGVRFVGSSATIINHNVIENVENHGIYLENSSVLNVSNNEISTVQQCGIYGRYFTGTINENTIDDTQEHGIRVIDSEQVDLIENNILNSVYSGISLRDNVYVSANMNTIQKAGMNGIAIESCKKLKVEGNTISEIESNGVYVKTSDVELKENIITNTLNGIRIVDLSNANVSKNTITDSTAVGISVDNNLQISIMNNEISNAKRNAIYAINILELKIDSNQIVACGEEVPAIGVYSSKEAQITKNTVTSSGRPGIYLRESDQSQILENVVTNSIGDGIYIYKCKDVVVSKNISTDNANRGIVASEAQNISILENTVSNNAGTRDIATYDGSTGVIQSNNTPSNRVVISAGCDFTISNNSSETTFTIQYNANGGSGSMATTTVTFGVNQRLRANAFTRPEFSFAGWNAYRSSDNKWLYVNASNTQSWFEQGKQPSGYHLYVYNDQQNLARTSNVDKDIVIMHAVWKVSTFDVQYNANGGSGNMATTTVTFGVNQRLRANTFTRPEFSFTGWHASRSSDNKWLYVNASNTQGWYEYNKQPLGFTLYTYSDQQNLARTSRVDKDIVTMHAVWRASTFTIQYNANGGSGNMATTTVTFGVNQRLRENVFTKPESSFVGWNASRSSDNKWLYVNTSNTQGWYERGKQPSGYYLYEYNDQQSLARTSRVDKDIVTMHAIWEVSTFTIQYNANGGSGNMATTTVTFGVNQKLRENVFAKPESSFTGWHASRKSDNRWLYVNASNTQGWYEQGRQPSGYHLYVYNDQQNLARTSRVDKDVVTMHALWRASTFTIQYNANGGSGNMATTAVTFGVNQKLRENLFTKPESSFAGWYASRKSDNRWLYVNASNTQAWYEYNKQPLGFQLYLYNDQQNLARTSRVDKDIVTMHALWRASTFTIQYNANGGSGNMATTTVTFGVNQRLRENAFTRSGASFVGWHASRSSDNRWLYVNASNTQGWYEQGKQPSGFQLYVYNNQQNLARTSRIDKDIVTMHAIWR